MSFFIRLSVDNLLEHIVVMKKKEIYMHDAEFNQWSGKDRFYIAKNSSPFLQELFRMRCAVYLSLITAHDNYHSYCYCMFITFSITLFFQIHINGRREIEILVNSALVEFDEQFMMDFQGATVIKYNNTSKYSFIFNSGLSVTIERVEDLLQFMLLVPPEFKGIFCMVF